MARALQEPRRGRPDPARRVALGKDAHLPLPRPAVRRGARANYPLTQEDFLRDGLPPGAGSSTEGSCSGCRSPRSACSRSASNAVPTANTPRSPAAVRRHTGRSGSTALTASLPQHDGHVDRGDRRGDHAPHGHPAACFLGVAAGSGDHVRHRPAGAGRDLGQAVRQPDQRRHRCLACPGAASGDPARSARDRPAASPPRSPFRTIGRRSATVREADANPLPSEERLPVHGVGVGEVVGVGDREPLHRPDRSARRPWPAGDRRGACAAAASTLS